MEGADRGGAVYADIGYLEGRVGACWDSVFGSDGLDACGYATELGGPVYRGREYHGVFTLYAGWYASLALLFVHGLMLRTGGMGINLTAASVVIMFDQDFNPHNDRREFSFCLDHVRH
jgi:hypothetical protein